MNDTASNPLPSNQKPENSAHTGVLGFIKKHIKKISSAIVMALIVGSAVQAIFGVLSTANDTLKVYVISNFNEPSSQSMQKAFVDEINDNLSIGGISINIDPGYSDEGDKNRAKEIAVEVASQEDTLLVVGHFSSTQTKAALPEYLKQEPPIPVILTTETNPTLLPFFAKAKHAPVLRLSPDDNVQAKSAADHALMNGNSFWVVEDTDNKVYSNHLALQFISNIKQQNKKVVLYTSANQLPSASTLEALDIDTVFYAGAWTNGLILVRQLKALFDYNIPSIILTDAAVDKEFIDRGGEDVEGVKIMFQMKAKLYEQKGYSPYGVDAANLANSLISRANQIYKKKDKPFFSSMLSSFRLQIARESLVESIAQYKDENLPLNGILTSGDYYFSDEGIKMVGNVADNQQAQFHIWTVQNGKFVDN